MYDADAGGHRGIAGHRQDREDRSAPPLPHLLLQLLWGAESLIHVGGELLHLVIHQQILKPERAREDERPDLLCLSVCLDGELIKTLKMKDVCPYLDEMTGSLTADGVDLPVHDGDDLSQRETDG